MDNIKIDISGYGAEIMIESLNDIQINYILAHNLECNTTIPIISESNELTYSNWRSINSEGQFYGLTLNSDVTIKVNDVVQNYPSINKENNTFINDNNKKYIMSIEHSNNVTMSYEFNVDNFDINLLSLMVGDLEELYWGGVIYAVKYDNQTYLGNIVSSDYYAFENMVIKNNTLIPIQKV
jgi:hypothetical protein